MRMSADEPRALQAPLEARYRGDPQTARVSARAEARLEGASWPACRVRGWAASFTAGLQRATGADGSNARSAAPW